MNVRGLQIGGTTTLTLDGDDLGTAPKLLLPFPAKATLQPKNTDKQATFAVELGDVSAGFAHLRVSTPGGVSGPVLVGVDKLPQKPFAADAGPLPVALHGSVSGSATVETTFAGKAGQKLTVEVEAARLGSKLRPVVHLTGPKKLQLSWAWPVPALLGDARFDATLPEDGTYTVSIHDLEYAAPAGSYFRLKLGTWDRVDAVFPPVVGKGTKAVELLGPGGAVSVPVPTGATGPVVMLDWPKSGSWGGPRPFVEMSPRPEATESAVPPNNPQELPDGPLGVSGRLLTPNEEDRFVVPVKPGDKLRLEVFAERLGSPIDAALVIRGAAGNQLARGEDSPGTLDPVLDYTVPDKVDKLLVCVVEAQGRGSPRGVYRLTVDRGEPVASDFRLSTPAQKLVLPAGGKALVPVLIDRRGYEGPVELFADALPAGTKLENAVIPAEADGALVVVTAPANPGDAAVTTWRGRADTKAERTVTLKGHPLERLQPWLATEFAVATVAAPAELFAVDWKGLPPDAAFVPGGKLALPVTVTRPGTAPVRLSIVVSQSPPLQNGQPNPQAIIRPEVAAPVEVPAKGSDVTLTVLVGPQVTGPVYDVAIQAELLSADKKTVLATAFTPVRRVEVRPPFTVKLAAATVEAKGGAFELTGTVERQPGFAGEVTLTLAVDDLRTRIPPLAVKASETKFSLKGTLPAKTDAGSYTGKLSATAAGATARPNARLRARDTEVTVVVKK